MSNETQEIMGYILLGFECIAALVGCFYFSKLKKSHWSWFSVYLVFIFIQEFFWMIIFPHDPENELLRTSRKYYYYFFGLPVQYFFFFWLYAFKALNKKRLFFSFLILYLITFIIPKEFKEINDSELPINIIIGSSLLTILMILEFAKQIRNEDILNFKENKMFYINIGILLFYVGTFPLSVLVAFGTSDEISEIDLEFFMYYFFISNYIMYTLFSISFIWGKKTQYL